MLPAKHTIPGIRFGVTVKEWLWSYHFLFDLFPFSIDYQVLCSGTITIAARYGYVASKTEADGTQA